MSSEMVTISFHYGLAFNQTVMRNYNQAFIKKRCRPERMPFV